MINIFLQKLALFITSFGGIGFMKPASATWGSFGAGTILFLFYPHISYLAKGIMMLIIFIVGWLLADYIEKTQKIHDPYFVVIDEVVGMMITTFFLGQVWWHFFIAFICFRVFDIAKLWPASYFDKAKGGFGIMIDDVIMAIPALGLTHLILYFV